MSKSWTATWWLDLQSLACPYLLGEHSSAFWAQDQFDRWPWLSELLRSHDALDGRAAARPKIAREADADGLPAWWDARMRNDGVIVLEVGINYLDVTQFFPDRRSLAVYVVAFSIVCLFKWTEVVLILHHGAKVLDFKMSTIWMGISSWRGRPERWMQLDSERWWRRDHTPWPTTPVHWCAEVIPSGYLT